MYHWKPLQHILTAIPNPHYRRRHICLRHIIFSNTHIKILLHNISIFPSCRLAVSLHFFRGRIPFSVLPVLSLILSVASLAYILGTLLGRSFVDWCGYGGDEQIHKQLTELKGADDGESQVKA